MVGESYPFAFTYIPSILLFVSTKIGGVLTMLRDKAQV
jgi:hypothetical protein